MVEHSHEPTFAAALRRCRQAAGLTQADLAERAGISERAVSDLERGIGRVPRRDTVDLLLRALLLEGAERSAFETAVQRARTLALANKGRVEQAPSRQSSSPSSQPPAVPHRHNLPAPLSSFIGRERELQQVRALVLVQPIGDAAGNRRMWEDAPGAGGSRQPDGRVPRRRLAGRAGFVDGCTVDTGGSGAGAGRTRIAGEVTAGHLDELCREPAALAGGR